MSRRCVLRVVIGMAAAALLIAVSILDLVQPPNAVSHARPLAETPPAAAARLRADFGRLPLQFEANQGQTDARVQFVSRGPGYTLFLTGGDAVLRLRGTSREAGSSAVVSMQLRGAGQARGAGESPLPGTSNYLKGNDPSLWRVDVPTYQRVRYDDVYDGIDLVYYGSQEQLEYDFIVAPGADPDRIALGFDGQREAYLDPQGDLVVPAATGDVRLRKPVVYQDGGGGREIVAGHYVMRAAGVGFEIGAYDRSRPLVIDPILSFSTYIGGSLLDFGHDIAVGPNGSVYVAGEADSTDFPLVNPLPTAPPPPGPARYDAFVTRINAAAGVIEYSTYIGGNSIDVASSIEVGPAGDIYVAGTTSSTNFPLQHPLQPYGGGSFVGGDAFVLKLTPAGNALVYSTYVGGSGDEYGRALAIDGSGNAYVVGSTWSSNFPIVNALQPGFGSTDPVLNDAFVFRINAAGTALDYSTYLGGSDDDAAWSVAVDGVGSVYVTGQTSSTNFPVLSPFQGAKAPNGKDAFVAKLDPSGTTLVYSSYLGGSNPAAPGGLANDVAYAIAVDSSGRAWVAGYTNAGAQFPSVGPNFGPVGGPADGFVARVSANGSVLERSRRLGGSGHDDADAIAIDSAGRIYVAGATLSVDFPTVAPLQPSNLGDVGDAFVVRIDVDGGALDFATFLGGTRSEYVSGLDVDAAGNLWAVGTTLSEDFPLVAPIRADTSFGEYAFSPFVFKITMGTPAPSIRVVRPDAPGQRVYTGTPFTIEWTADNAGSIESFDVDVSTNDGATYVPMAGCSDLPGSARSCEWSAPGPVTTKGRIRVRATDASGTSTSDVSDARFSILAGSATLAVALPNTALTLVAGSTQQVKWTHNLGAQSWVRIEASRNGGTTWENVAASVKNTSSSSGTFVWDVTGPNTTQGRVRVTWLNGPVRDTSNVNFSIVTPVLTMSKPVAGSNWGWETTQTVYWNTNLGKSEHVNIRLSENGGATWPFLVATNLDASKGRAAVATPILAASTNQARLKVEWVAHEFVNAVSPADFRVAMPFLTITRPAGPAHAWTIGTSPTITWAHNLGTLENVRLELSRDGGATFPIVLSPSTRSDGKEKFTVLAAWATTQGRARITWLDNPWLASASATNFPIQ